MAEFGKTLKQIVRISGLKYSVLARKLNFDTSYISKWANNGILPSSRIIDEICRSCGEIVMETSGPEEKVKLAQMLKLDYLGPAQDEALQKRVSQELLSAYKSEEENRDAAAAEAAEAFTAPSEQRRDIFRKLSDHRMESDTISIDIVGDLCMFTLDDILFLMDLEYHVIHLDYAHARINCYLSELRPDTVSNQIARAYVALVNLLIISDALDTRFYNIHAAGCGLSIFLQDHFLFTAQILHNAHWHIERFDYSPQILESFRQFIHRDLAPFQLEAFTCCGDLGGESSEVLNRSLRIRISKALCNKFTELLLDSDMLETILSSVDCISEEAAKRIRIKHRFYTQRVHEGAHVKIILFKRAFELLVYKGILCIMGYEITVPLELRMKILESLKATLESCPNLELKIVEQFLIHEVKHTYLPNFALSDKSGLFYGTAPRNPKPANIINSSTVHSVLRDTFDYIWAGKLVALLPPHQVLEEQISLCNEIMFFDLM